MLLVSRSDAVQCAHHIALHIRDYILFHPCLLQCTSMYRLASVGDKLLVSCSDSAHYVFRTLAPHMGPIATLKGHSVGGGNNAFYIKVPCSYGPCNALLFVDSSGVYHTARTTLSVEATTRLDIKGMQVHV